MARPSKTHTRDPSLTVRFSRSDILTVAQEIYDGTVADVTLSLFTIWIKDAKEHYEQATEHIRELGLDQGYPTNRITNDYLRQLLDDCASVRPSPPASGELKSVSGRNTPRNSGAAPAPLTTRSTSYGSFGAESRPSPIREFPPNTPDRPAPLNIRSASGSGSQTSGTRTLLRSVSSPIRMQQAARSLQSRVPLEVLEATATLAELAAAEAAEEGKSRDLEKNKAIERFIDDLPDKPQEFESVGQRQGNELTTQSFTTGPPPALFQRRAGSRARREAQASSDVLDIAISGINRPLPLRHAPPRVRKSESPPQGFMEQSRRLDVNTTTDTFSGLTCSSSPITHVLAPGGYRSPASNATPTSKPVQLLPPRRYASEASPPHFRGHLLRSASQPVPARIGNDEKIEGLQELAIRIGPNALKPRTLPRARGPSRTSWSTTSSESSPSKEVPTLSSTLHPSQERNDVGTSAPGEVQEVRSRITAEYMANALEQIRARGRILPMVRKTELDEAEIRWREDNKVLSFSLYGRTDVFFTEKDREFVDFVAGELKEDLGKVAGLEWVALLFKRFD
ncbi:uncharacterized protein EI97DRAFT_466585 [Westerdykella ornata]|uniref:Uncharacterized protein n=1 Tax=Westerdykella ornata TaxID=318751 RepID=A0A6A6JLA5_WESOR|nr:uncharacterized protein EI97DRAFT_466585 [Westerdykella ornata]KAF2277034.1 hypothetical protein EI97DRAFT_466585 [Westerdykella ornata]